MSNLQADMAAHFQQLQMQQAINALMAQQQAPQRNNFQDVLTQVFGSGGQPPPMATSAPVPSGPSQADQQFALLKQELAKKQIEAQLQQLAQQSLQGQYQTQNLGNQLAAQEMKQKAWMAAFGPYMQQLGMDPNIMSISQRANPRLGQAMDAAYVWGGEAEPWKRSFQIQNSTSAGVSTQNQNMDAKSQQVQYQYGWQNNPQGRR
jgi:hypothetical protein